MNCDGCGREFHASRSVSQIHCPCGRSLDVQPMRGLGDLIAVTIKKVTRGKVKPCAGCKGRQEKLNELVPFNRE